MKIATYIPQDNDGVLIGDISAGTQTNDIKITLDSEEVAINDGGNTITVDGTVTANLSATDNTVLDNIDSNTDFGQVTGGGVEASALRVTIANNSTGVLSVDDGGGTLTVDGTVAATQSGTWNIGTLTTITNDVNIADGGNVISVDDAGGSLTVDGTVTANLSATDNAVLDNIDSNTDYGQVTGGGTEASALRVTIANNSSGVVSVDDNGSSLTVDNSVLSVTGGGTEASAQRVTIANNSTGVLSVDDNGSSLTVDASNLDIRSLQETEDVVSAALATDKIMQDTTARTPKFASISASSSGNNTLVAAVASRKIRVLSCILIADDTVDVRFESGASGTALTGQMALVANTGFTLPFNPVGWMETAATNTLLNLELSAAVGVNGCITYLEVT